MILLDKEGISVCIVDTGSYDDTVIEKMFNVADDYIKQRIQKLKNEQQKINALVGSALRKYLIKKRFDLSFDDQIVGFEKNGKPFLKNHPNIHFNISHSGNFVACAVGDKPVGIDIERISKFNEKVAKYVFWDDEIQNILISNEPDVEFTKMWSKKEACVKLSGVGIQGLKKERFDNVLIVQKILGDYVLTVAEYK